MSKEETTHLDQMNFWEERIWIVYMVLVAFSFWILWQVITNEDKLSYPIKIPALFMGLAFAMYSVISIIIMNQKREYHLNECKDLFGSKQILRIGIWGDLAIAIMLIVCYIYYFGVVLNDLIVLLAALIFILAIIVLLLLYSLSEITNSKSSDQNTKKRKGKV